MVRRILVAVGLAALMLGCVTTGPGGQTSLIVIPTSQEVAIGQAMAAEVAATQKQLVDPQWQQPEALPHTVGMAGVPR